MKASDEWSQLGWRHDLWDLVRYYCALRGARQKEAWLGELTSYGKMSVGDSEPLPVEAEDVALLTKYLAHREKLFEQAFAQLRTEEEALRHCENMSVMVGETRTQNADHHQSSKALVAGVSSIAARVAAELGVSVDEDPQRRCVWCRSQGLHVTARNLDGAIPGLANPDIIWEIKEYWGKTSGGSKMSDAVYECNLVGRELREFEERVDLSVAHVVFVDGRDQWAKRKSDLARFLDLMNQGLIDHLFIGREIETGWEPTLRSLIESRNA